MKRLIAILLVLVLALGAASSLADVEHHRYDFDFRFEMDPDAYPFRMREHMQGYRELLDALEFRGQVLWSPGLSDGYDIRMELIPLTDPDASINVRIFGRPSDVCIQSPLMGEEPYFLGNTHMILTFFSQFCRMTGVPLPSLALLNPYNAIYATQLEVQAWKDEIPEIKDGTVIPNAQLKRVCKAWKDLLETDEDFEVWMDGFYAQMKDAEPLVNAVDALPDLLLAAAGGQDLTVKDEDGFLVCRNAEGLSVFRVKKADDEYYLEFAPETAGEYTPYFCYGVRREADGTRSLALKASLVKESFAEDEPSETLLDFSLEASGIPESFPGETHITAKVSAGGSALPSTHPRIELNMKADGETELTMIDAEDKQLFRAYGTVTETEYDMERDGYLLFEFETLSSYPHLLVANYKTVSEVTENIVPVFVEHIMDFIYALPTRACQSIMDDLETGGILDTLLEGVRIRE